MRATPIRWKDLPIFADKQALWIALDYDLECPVESAYSAAMRLSGLPLTNAACVLLVSGCAWAPYSRPGIQPREAKELEKVYYWQPGTSLSSFTDAQILKLFVESLEPLDGERAELHTSQLIWALAASGDRHFSDLLSKQTRKVQISTLEDVSYVWRDSKLHYPLTERMWKELGSPIRGSRRL